MSDFYQALASWKDVQVVRFNENVEIVRCIVSNSDVGHDVVYVPLAAQYESDKWRWMVFVKVEGEEARADRILIRHAQPVVIKRFRSENWFNGLRESEALQTFHEIHLGNRNIDPPIARTFRPPHKSILHYVTTLYNDANKEHYVVTHYFGGLNVDLYNFNYCSRQGRLLPTDKVKQIVFQCIESLYIIHCQYGFVHLHFTGSNVLLSNAANFDNPSDNLHCRTGDFECSMATNEQGYSDFKDFICFLEEQYIGSKSLSDLDLDTKPPEMFWKKYQCEPYHPQALDVWALGVLTMKLMTGGYNYLTVDFNANKVMMELSPWFHLLRDNPEQFSLTFSASVHNADHDLIRLMTHMLCPYPANRIDVKNLFESIHK